MHVVMWEFQVKPDRVADFERIYGPEGDWVALLKQAPGYLGTELLRDDGTPGRYLNLDRWKSDVHRRRFRKAYAAQYQALDMRCDELTLRERHLGDYTWEESYPSTAPPLVDFRAAALASGPGNTSATMA